MESEAAGTPAVRNHRRFALTDVRLDDRAVGGATIDVWQDQQREPRWAARILMPSTDVPPGGMLEGRLRDGRTVRGRVVLVGAGPALRNRGPVLMEWRGTGTLEAVEEPAEG